MASLGPNELSNQLEICYDKAVIFHTNEMFHALMGHLKLRATFELIMTHRYHMAQGPGSSLVQVIAYYSFDPKPLPDPLVTYAMKVVFTIGTRWLGGLLK